MRRLRPALVPWMRALISAAASNDVQQGAKADALRFEPVRRRAHPSVEAWKLVPLGGTSFSGLRHLLRFEDIFGSGRRHSTCDHQARAWEGNDKKNYTLARANTRARPVLAVPFRKDPRKVSGASRLYL